MPDFLQGIIASGTQASALEVLVRLLTAFGFGLVIAGIYAWTRGREAASSFAMTLLLLSVLIAMVTQVIGDNVARAFSLVGALSIVRFRTVVRDTQDTAYVILAVIVGMAVGAWSLWVAALGIAVVGLAEAVYSATWRVGRRTEWSYELRLRAAPDRDPDALLETMAGTLLERREILSMGSVKQGEMIEARYLVRPAKDIAMADVLRALTASGVFQSVQFVRQDQGENG